MKKAIVISCFDWFEKRLEPIMETLEKQYEVIALLSDFNHIKKKRITHYEKHCRYINVPTYKKNLSFKRIKSHISFTNSVKNELMKESPDFIYCLIPPNGLAKCCIDYKRIKPEVKIVFDIIDLWPESMPLWKLNNSIPCVIWKNMRDKYISFADGVFLECELYKKQLNGVLPANVEILYLYKNQNKEEEQLICKTRLIKQKNIKKELNIAYLGSINYIIDIERIKSVITILKSKYEIIVHIIGKGENKENLINSIRSTGAKVKYYGPIFEEKQKIAILSNCDFALNMMVDTVKVGLTIKSIDYMSYGLPMINTIKGDTWKLIEEYSIGVNYDGNKEMFLKKIEEQLERNSDEIINIYKNNFSKTAFLKQLKSGLEKCSVL